MKRRIMQTTLAVTAVCLAMLPDALNAAPFKPALVEFRHVGDDALSERLAEGVERAFSRSPDFALSSGRKPGTLVVTIPTNVEWKKMFGRTKVLFTVEFASETDQKIGVSSGSCWEGTLATCAAQIIREARVAARSLQAN